jgi:uncharacterized membrane protein YdjX (TVP38/TMEM64 family)
MSQTSKPKLSRSVRNSLLLLVPGILGALTIFLLWRAHPEPSYWQELFEDGMAFLQENPWALILAVATLPGMGFPISPLLFLFGVVLAPRYGMIPACAIGIAAQSFCTTWTYLLASGPLRGVLKKFVSRKHELPQLTHRNAIRLCLIMRITPGIPYAIQNVVLGIAGMRPKPYFLVSIPITAMWTIGFIVTGGAIFKGHAGLAITGLLLLVTMVLLTKMLRQKTRTNDG